MKAIAILQPWASLIACRHKKIETRSWPTKYRGPIAIHAAKSLKSIDFVYDTPIFREKYELAFGSVIAIAELVDCFKVIGKVSLKIGDRKQVIAVLENQMKIMGNEYEFGDYSIGRFAWILDNVRQIDPVPARGQQRLWNWDGGQS